MANQEASFTLAQLEKLLKSVSNDVVLVGGQALAFWANFYDINNALIGANESLTKDVDFLGKRKDVKEIADGVSGTASYPSEHAMTILAGQVTIKLGANDFLNIDVIRRVGGLDTDAVKSRALTSTLGDATFQVMHPLDVLKSRIENLATIPEKQNSTGIAQARLSLLVANKFIQALTQETDGQKMALKGIEYIASVAKSPAGCKSSREFGIDFFQSIPVESINVDLFHANRWPRLVAELQKSAGIYVSKEDGQSNSLAVIWNALPATSAHSGVIVATSDSEVIQHVGLGRHVVWPRRQLFGDPIEVDKFVNIGRDGEVQNDRSGPEVSV